MKFSVKRDKSGSAHELSFEPRKWSERSIVSIPVAAERAWTIGAQRYLKENWPTGLTGGTLVTELIRLARDVFVYGGPSKAPPTAESVGIEEGDDAPTIMAKMRRAGVLS